MPIALFNIAKYEVNEISWCTSYYRTSHAEDFSSNHFCFHASTVIVLRNVVSLEILVLRLTELVPCIKVDPKLETI